MAFVVRDKSHFFGSELMIFDPHYIGGDMLVYTSEQKAWVVLMIRTPPPWRASAVISQSRPTALLIFMAAIASAVSSRVNGSVQMGRSLLAGGGRCDEVKPLSLSKSELD